MPTSITVRDRNEAVLTAVRQRLEEDPELVLPTLRLLVAPDAGSKRYRGDRNGRHDQRSGGSRSSRYQGCRRVTSRSCAGRSFGSREP